MGEAYHLLKSEIEKHPQKADLQRRMGNLLKNGEKPEMALPYYLGAIRINPDDAESYYNIVDILIDQKRYREAIPYLEQLVPSCRECKMDEGLRRDIFSALLGQADIVQKETGHKVELFLLAKSVDIAREKESVTIDIRSFEFADFEEFESLYHVFRYGRVPEKRPKAEETIEATRQREEAPRLPVTKGKKVGRNDPCPCGSGKKYKTCCGR
ncbi:SEC-C metal-binding domain-containing protein [Chloroflexota bacterium]